MKDPARTLFKSYVGGVILFFVLLFLFAKPCHGQQFKIRDHIAPAAAVFVAGCFEGAMDGLQFHYDRPNDFWNPDISWIRKYKNRDVAQGLTFRGRFMVWTTDGWHLMKAGRNASLFTGFVLRISPGKKQKWYWYVVEYISYWGINRAGFNLVYSRYK